MGSQPGTRLGTRPPDQPPREPKILESLLLSVAHHWSLRETGDRQVELLERHFRQEEMVYALRELAVLMGQTERPPLRNPGAGKKMTAPKAQAMDMVNTLEQLSDKAITPRILVQSDDLPRIKPLLGAMNVGDERGVAARLEALENSQRQGLEKMERLMGSMARSAMGSAASPHVIVTPPPPQSFSAVAARGGRAGAGATRGWAAQTDQSQAAGP